MSETTTSVQSPNDENATDVPYKVIVSEKPKDKIVAELIGRGNQIANFLGVPLKDASGNENPKVMKFRTAVMSVYPKLKEKRCTTESIVDSFMKCAELNLFPSSVSGEAYILPYWDKAQFQLGYQGIITLLYRAGIQSISTEIVYQNDTFRLVKGTNASIEHEPTITWPKGAAIGVYAIAKVNGELIWTFLSKDEVMEFKKFSKSVSSGSSPWNPASDPQLHMWRKTAIKQLSKTLPKNETVAIAFAYDNEDGDIKDYHKRACAERLDAPSYVHVEDIL